MSGARAWAGLVALLVGGLVSSCASSGQDVLEPSLGGKADVMSEVDYRGQMSFGGEAIGEFVNDFQFDAWTFRAAAGAVVSVETTQQGTSRSLDNTLFLYGPADEQGVFDGPRLVMDNDSGWGKQAAIRDVSLVEDGTYLVVVGTIDGAGRGRYRLTLACASASCDPAPAEVEGCPGQIHGDFEMCMEAAIYEGGEMRDEALEGCTEYVVSDLWGDQCEYEAVSPDWCGVGYERFESVVVPACVAIIEEAFPSEHLDVCDPILLPYLEDCVVDTMIESGATKARSIDDCTDESTWEGLSNAACELSSPNWCAYELAEVHSLMAADCQSQLDGMTPFGAPPAREALAEMTRGDIDGTIGFYDEGWSCGIRNFEMGDVDERTNPDGVVYSLTVRSTVEGPANYCAGYTSYDCSTDFEPRRGQWGVVESDCEDVGGIW